MTVTTDRTLIAGRRLRYSVRRSRQARRPGIEVSRRTGVVVILPRRAARALVPDLLDHWSGWIARQAER